MIPPRPKPEVLPPGIAGHNRTMVTPHYAVMPPEGILESRLPGFERTILRFHSGSWSCHLAGFGVVRGGAI